MAKDVSIKDTGLDEKLSELSGRLLNKNGQPMVRKSGQAWYKNFSVYHTLMHLSIFKFIGLIFVIYSAINFIFGLTYYLLGARALGLNIEPDSKFELFYNCFFFSAQTLSTVGYGRLSPITFGANVVSSLESLLGLLLFALITGLSYARFALPKSYLKFSNNILLNPFQDAKALMFRVVSTKNNLLTDIHCRLTASVHNLKDGVEKHEYFNLKLEIEKINLMPFNWTIVHKINEESPFWNFTVEDFNSKHVEIIAYLRGFDEGYSAQVVARSSYTAAEIIPNAKFKLMYKIDKSEQYINLNIDKLDEIEFL